MESIKSQRRVRAGPTASKIETPKRETRTHRVTETYVPSRERERERERERRVEMERSAVLAGLQPNQLLCPSRRHPSTQLPSFPFTDKTRSSPFSLKVLLRFISSSFSLSISNPSPLNFFLS
jgi:hypothetical protein